MLCMKTEVSRDLVFLFLLKIEGISGSLINFIGLTSCNFIILCQDN